MESAFAGVCIQEGLHTGGLPLAVGIQGVCIPGMFSCIKVCFYLFHFLPLQFTNPTEKKDVIDFLLHHCQSRAEGTLRKQIVDRYTFLVEHVEADPLGVLVQPTRMDRVGYMPRGTIYPIGPLFQF